jgi:hypothetical protein
VVLFDKIFQRWSFLAFQWRMWGYVSKNSGRVRHGTADSARSPDSGENKRPAGGAGARTGLRAAARPAAVNNISRDYRARTSDHPGF